MRMIFSDLELSKRLERAEARSNADFVETRARLEPDSGATWIEVGGAYAMFDGVESPCTQTFGLGLFEDTTDGHLDEIEAFFADHDAPVFHEVSPMAAASLDADAECSRISADRTFERAVSGTRTASDVPVTSNPNISTRIISPDEVDLWARTSAAGWATEHEGLADFMFAFGRISAQCDGAYPYLAELDGNPVATGMLFIHGDVAMLAGASTIPEGRNNGAQNALLAARLKFAEERGCTLAAMGTAPGSQSQKNGQKNGFNIAYTRIKWQLDR